MLHSALTALIVGVALIFGGFTGPKATAETQPNILVVMVDDFDQTMYRHFPRFQQGAAVFPSFIYSTALCCPTRATLLTGMYSWNTGMWTNSPGEEKFRNRLEDHTTAVLLDSRGYSTGYFGKYMNGYTDTHIPPGWDEWHAWRGTPVHRNMVHNKKVRHEEGHYDDTTGRVALEWVHSVQQPFYGVVSFYSPHGPRAIAERHRGIVVDEEREVQRERVLSTYPAYEHFQTLLAAVPENTYVFLLTDNGYHLGDVWYAEGKGKNTPFSTDAQVSLSVWGPGVVPGNRSQLTTTVDMFSTLSDIAGDQVDKDGLSILPYLYGLPSFEREYVPMFHRDWDWSIRSKTQLYLERGNRLWEVGNEGKGESVDGQSIDPIVRALRAMKGCDGSECLR